MGYLIDILIGAAASLVAKELWSDADPASQLLVRKAVQRLPEEDRERFGEEWLADLHDVPGAFGKLLWASGCHWAATLVNVRAWQSRQKLSLPEGRTIQRVGGMSTAAKWFQPVLSAGRVLSLVVSMVLATGVVASTLHVGSLTPEAALRVVDEVREPLMQLVGPPTREAAATLRVLDGTREQLIRLVTIPKPPNLPQHPQGHP
jgi:hypothetical protein